MHILALLFIVFFKIGLFSFGGGYAMISLLRIECLNNNFITAKEFSDIVALSQVTPGPIAVNLATFVGFKQMGVLGSCVATLAVILPSIILALSLYSIIKKFNDSDIIKNAFYGLKPAVIGLILVAAVNIGMEEFYIQGDFEFISIFIAIIAFILSYKFKVNPIYLIIASAIAGIIVFSIL